MFFSNKKVILLFVITFIITRILFIVYPFWGLEYEDSFIYSDTGRFLNYNYDYKSMPFKCQSCLDGSYTNCFLYGSYGGHLLTIPLLLAVINSTLGFHTWNIFFLNLAFSILTISIIIFYFYKRNLKDTFSLTTFLSLLVITPFLSVFNTSGLAETVSAFFVISFTLAIYKVNENNFKIKSADFWFAIIFIFLAVLTKRENFVLLIIIYIIPIIRYQNKDEVVNKGYLLFTLTSSLLLSIFTLFIGLFNIENNEGKDIGTNTFSYDFFVINIKQFLTAITNVSYWGVTGLLFIFSIGFVIFKRKINMLGLLCLLITLSYITLYSTHYRSYYQVVHDLSHPFETLRYSVNYFPILALFISSLKINWESPQLQNKIPKSTLRFGILIVISVLVLNVVKTRIEFSSDENLSRIEPVKELLSIACEDDIIITDIPIIFHCFANENQNIIDIFNLNNYRFKEIISSKNEKNIYLLKPKDFQNGFQRHHINFELTNFKRLPFASNNFVLLKYSK